ncbi:MAG: hypothetical protein ACRCTJ_02180, partial [Brevinema sp.]
KHIKTPNDEQLANLLEQSTGFTIVEQGKVETISQQIQRILRNPKTNKEILGESNYDTEDAVKHFKETGQMPIGRFKDEDYFEIFDKQQILKKKFELAEKEYKSKLAEKQKAEKEVEKEVKQTKKEEKTEVKQE